jgi:hypothetical protein
MAVTGRMGDPVLGGILRVTPRPVRLLAHVLDNLDGEATGTWTGLACPGHGLPIGSDVGNDTLTRLADKHGIASLHWQPPEDFTAEHAHLCTTAIHACQSGNPEWGEELWQQATALWSQAWSANLQVLELMQEAGLHRFSLDKPQRWVVASFEHHTSPHGLPQPHIHNIVIPALTAPTARQMTTGT